jgi:3-hydroxy-D-aspartate aldolase
MNQETVKKVQHVPAWAANLPTDVSTPCFAIYEQGVIDNLHATARAGGGIHRLMPHVKTHRAQWVTERLLDEGVQAFKASTVAEVRMILAAGAPYAVWAYPSANPTNIREVIDAAREYPNARVGALVDSLTGSDIWRKVLDSVGERPSNLSLIVDLDPGMGRTGAPISHVALDIVNAVKEYSTFGGFHVYDGHIQGSDETRRRQLIGAVVEDVRKLLKRAAELGMSTELIAGGSYSFNVWPSDLARYVSPGSWTYSSDQHDVELASLGWTPSAYVIATVVSVRGNTATLDAGSKAISPDKVLKNRFRWDGEILAMSEEHVVVENDGLDVGDRVFLMPRHACTTAYLYDEALVLGRDSVWSYRDQLGNKR